MFSRVKMPRVKMPRDSEELRSCCTYYVRMAVLEYVEAKYSFDDDSRVKIQGTALCAEKIAFGDVVGTLSTIPWVGSWGCGE